MIKIKSDNKNESKVPLPTINVCLMQTRVNYWFLFSVCLFLTLTYLIYFLSSGINWCTMCFFFKYGTMPVGAASGYSTLDCRLRHNQVVGWIWLQCGINKITLTLTPRSTQSKLGARKDVHCWSVQNMHCWSVQNMYCWSVLSISS